MCGRKASHYFSLAEGLRPPSADPFVWVFIRPPWSPSGSCCKAVVYERLQAECDANLVRAIKEMSRTFTQTMKSFSLFKNALF